MSKQGITSVFAAVLCVWAAASFAAVVVEADWPMPEQNATEPRERKAAVVQRGIAMAVAQKAFDMLPDAVSQTRRELLAEMLRLRAGEFVHGYTEQGEIDTPQGQALRLSVDVNKRGLKRTLTSMGLMRKDALPTPYQLQLDGPDAAWGIIGRLQLLTGVEPAAGADLRVELTKSEDMWRGKLTQSDATSLLAAQVGENLESVWWDLWSRYFTESSAQADSAAGLELVMQGWYTADGVQAFDAMLRSWENLMDDAELASVTLEAATLTARWRVYGARVAALQSRLAGYVKDRGLTYELAEASE